MSDKICKSVTNFLKIRSIYLSEDGKQMKRELLALVSFTNKLKNSTQVCHITSSDFIKNEFAPFYPEHGHKLHGTVLFDLLKRMMNVLKGNPRAKIGKKQ